MANSIPFAIANIAAMLSAVVRAWKAKEAALAEKDIVFKDALNPSVVISPFLQVLA